MNWTKTLIDLLYAWAIPNLVSEFVYGLLFTSVVGTILFFCWFLLSLLLKRMGRVGFAYRVMKWLPITMFIPVFFVSLRYLDHHHQVLKGHFSTPSGSMQIAAGVFFMIWVVASILQVIRIRKEEKEETAFLDHCTPCRKTEEEVLFQLASQAFPSGKKVTLSSSYGAPGPVQVGIRKPMVVLPGETLSEAELKASFCHELIHIKHRDVLFRCISMWCRIFHFFNPFVWLMDTLVRRWSEYACDDEAAVFMGNRSLYMRTLDGMEQRYQEISSRYAVGLFEKKSNWRRRVSCMLLNKKKGRYSRYAVVVLSLLCLLGGAVFASAATYQMGSLYTDVWQATVVDEEIDYTPPTYVIEEDEGPAEGVKVVRGEVEYFGVDRSITGGSINWTVGVSTSVESDSFYVAAGKTIYVFSVFSPANQNMRAGIVRADGTRAYATGMASLSPSFSITSSGNYKVFVENLGNQSVTATGSFVIQ